MKINDTPEDDEKSKPSILCCKLWILSVVMAAFIMGTVFYVYALHFADKGLIAPVFLGPIAIIPSLILKVFVLIHDKVKKGAFLDRKNSNILNE